MLIALGEFTRYKLGMITKDEGMDNATPILLRLIFLVYPSTSACSLMVFLCRNIDGNYYLEHDYRFQCYTSEWMGDTWALRSAPRSPHTDA